MASEDVNEITAARTKTHGEYRDVALMAQDLKFLMRRGKNWKESRLSAVQMETLEMYAHKIARILSGDPNEKDHWVDIGGYSKITADRL